MPALHELSAKLQRLQAGLVDAIEEEYDDHYIQALESALEETSEETSVKVEHSVKFYQNLKGEYEAMHVAKKELAARVSAMDRRMSRLKGYILGHVATLPSKRLKTALFNTYMVRGRERIEVFDKSKLPKMFHVEHEWTVGQMALNEFVIGKDGELPAGCKRTRGEPHIVIK